MALLTAGCIDLNLAPSAAVGDIISNVVASGEALPESAHADGGTTSLSVTGRIVGRLRCDDIRGKVDEGSDSVDIVITVVSGDGCNSLTPTTFEYVANFWALKPGKPVVRVSYAYDGVEGQEGVRFEGVITIN